MSSLNLTLPSNTLRRGSESMMSEGPLTPPSSRPTSPAHANATEQVEEEDMTEDSLADLEDDCDIVVDAEPRFSGPRSQLDGGSDQLHLPPTPASTVSTELPHAEGAPSKPSRLLDDEHSHVQKSGSGSITLRDFEVQGTLGSGTFGRVLLVRLRSAVARGSSQQYFALKVLRKSEVVKLRQVEHVNAERYILSRTRHPFVVDLYATFQDKLNIYMLLSYVPGGELFTHLRRARRFSPDVTRFYLATIVLALKYLHSFNIIYRDLKPENLLLDQRGYLRLTDFGFAKIVDDRTWTLCGTPEYLAPEIVLSEGHGKAADWWACGVLAYEMMVGYPPFFDTTPFGIYHKIVHAEVLWPPGIDAASRAFVDALLVKDRSKRLGNMGGGAQDVLDHPWFRGVDWELLERQEIRAPIVPQFSSHGDMRHFLHLPHPPADEIPGLMQNESPPTLHERFDPVAYQFMEF